MIKIGIIGGAGYTAGELLRILLSHPTAKVTYIHSSSHAGEPVTAVHSDLIGDIDLIFSGDYCFDNLDVIFLCMGHGKSKIFMEEHTLPTSLKVIDMSNDFRLRADAGNFIYGLPEINREKIKNAQFIANPGCFATAIQLALLPLASQNLIDDEIHVNAITGSTGAGQQPSATSHFSWRSGNLSAYKIFSHQHLGEINESLNQLQNSYQPALNFIPIRGNHTRGIYATAYTHYEGSIEEAKILYTQYYAAHPFVHVVDKNPDLKQIVNTNKCLLYLEKHGDKLVVISIIDNLIKGASGQAVQNMNLIFGLEESTGLYLKPIGF